MIRTLPRVVAADPGKPRRAGAAAIRAATRALAEDAGRWSADLARDTVTTYTGLAPIWDGERGAYRRVPLADALARGGPMPAGCCVDVGCGTGLLTPLLERHWSRVVGLDLTWEMLRRSAAPWRVLADASRLPLAGGRTAALVLADAPLFAAEAVRVLAPDGVIVWSNALGEDAPHHVPVPAVVDLLDRATPGRAWDAVTAEAGWGRWAVFRRH